MQNVVQRSPYFEDTHTLGTLFFVAEDTSNCCLGSINLIYTMHVMDGHRGLRVKLGALAHVDCGCRFVFPMQASTPID